MSLALSAVAQWTESPTSGAAIALADLTPYLLTDGSVQFLARTDVVPVGAIVATVVNSGSGDDQIVTPATTGRRPIVRADGALILL